MRGWNISQHAVQRYRERIRDVAPHRARREICFCIEAGKPRHLRKLKRKKKTTMVPTGCCMFVVSRGAIATVIETPYPGMSYANSLNQLHAARSIASNRERRGRSVLSHILDFRAKAARLLASWRLAGLNTLIRCGEVLPMVTRQGSEPLPTTREISEHQSGGVLNTDGQLAS